MPPDVFGERVNDNVSIEFKGAAEIGRGHRVVDDQRDPMAMGDLGQLHDIHHIAGWIADRFTEEGAGVFINRRLEAIIVIRRDHAYFHPLARKSVGKEIVGTTVELTGADDVATDVGDALDCVGDRRHAGGECQCADAALHRSEALLQYIGGGVHDAGVDIAGNLEVKQIGTMLCVIERVGGGLINRNGRRFGGRF